MPDFERIPAGTSEEGADGPLECVFCGQTSGDGKDLIAANGTAICDECAAACVEALNKQTADESVTSEQDDESAARASFRALSDADVEQLLDTDALVDAMEETLRRVLGGKPPQSANAVLAVAGGSITSDTAYAPADGAAPTLLGTQVTSAFDGNVATGLPATLETLLLLNPDTGAVVAVVAGGYLADACAAATSALSARLLARDDAGRLAILGSGRIARLHLEALDRVFELSSVRVWSPTSEDQEALLEKIESKIEIEAARSAEDAVRCADLVVIAVPPDELTVRAEWIADGTHVMIAGLADADTHNVVTALTKRGHVFSGSRVLAATRNSPREVTMFESAGTTLAHVAAANLMLQKGAAS